MTNVPGGIAAHEDAELPRVGTSVGSGPHAARHSGCPPYPVPTIVGITAGTSRDEFAEPPNASTRTYSEPETGIRTHDLRITRAFKGVLSGSARLQRVRIRAGKHG